MTEIDEVISWLAAQTEQQRKRVLTENPEAIGAVLAETTRMLKTLSPMSLATVIDEGHRSLPHLDFLDAKLVKATQKVEAGESQFLRVSMPPRSGKSVTISEYLPLWLLTKHPDWKIGLISHSPSLASSWGRQIRRLAEDETLGLGLEIARDAGAVTDWETTEGGGVSSRSVGQSITGRGFQVMIVDDAVKDYSDAASETRREALKSWWQTTARTRLEPPSLVVVVGTRWHEDDFTGWVSTTGDPFQVVSLPAIAEERDVLGRKVGDPLFSPFIKETREEALKRWEEVETSVGPHAWAALYQQRPNPAGGSVFTESDWKYWTTDPALVGEGTVLFNPSSVRDGVWIDSWDIASTDKEESDYSVGQRWVRDSSGRKFLVAQSRTQTRFNDTLSILREWAKPMSCGGTGRFVGKRYVEQASNGYAIIDTLSREIPGVVPVIPKGSKEVRAMAVTPQVSRGEVLLPHPAEPGNEWVHGLLGELKVFPNGKHDDQVDSLTQALSKLEVSSVGRGSISVPSGPVVGRRGSRLVQAL